MRTLVSTFALRIAIAFSLLYPSLSALFSLEKWLVNPPSFLNGIVDAKTLTIIIAGYEILLAILVLIKPNPSTPAMVVFISVIVFITFNYTDMNRVYRDIPLALSALALSFLSRVRS
jgi:hypothetical protein